MTDAVFVSLLRHTCSIVQAGTSSGAYGHTDWDWTSGITTTASVKCHYSRGNVSEIEDARNQGTTVQHHVLWLAHDDAPASLRAAGANINHRITTIVRTDTGASIDAGPFDIEEITDMAGQHMGLRLILKRVT